jgi:nucleotide-binding universal stress UspA family protein
VDIMPRPVIVGLDGSSEGRAAAEWAAREARLRGLPLRVVHVREPAPDLMARAPLLGAETHQYWTESIPREAAEGLRRRHPGVEVNIEHLDGQPGEVLARTAEDAEALVLGSRALSGIGGFLVGSVSLAVVARAARPVVLVRTGEQAADEHEMDPAGIPCAAAAFRPVVLGLDAANPDTSLIEFAFEAAGLRATALRVVYAWNRPPFRDHRGRFGAEPDSLSEVLGPWREKFPTVEVMAESRTGGAADLLIEASREASLVVVGRRVRRGPFTGHIGSVTHAVLHHATCPVAVVPERT